MLLPQGSLRRLARAPPPASGGTPRVDEGITFVDLKATLTRFAQRFFGPIQGPLPALVLPFTEPSAEMGRGVPDLPRAAACRHLQSNRLVRDEAMRHGRSAVFEKRGARSRAHTAGPSAWARADGRNSSTASATSALLYEADVRLSAQLVGADEGPRCAGVGPAGHAARGLPTSATASPCWACGGRHGASARPAREGGRRDGWAEAQRIPTRPGCR